MARIGMSPDELAAVLWEQSPPTYAAQTPDLNVLSGEVVALIGDGTRPVLEGLADALDRCAWVDGAVAAQGGVLRVHALQAARVGVRALAVTGPVDEPGLDRTALGLAVADLATVSELPLTALIEVSSPEVAARFAERVAVVEGGRVRVAYPLIGPAPRVPADVTSVTDRLRSRLPAGC